MFFRKNKSKDKKILELQLQIMMQESQKALLAAATSTANAAQDVTTTLRDRLDDSIRQFEHTASILNDALFLTEPSGLIQSCNPAAGRMFGRSDIVGLNITDLFTMDGVGLVDATQLWQMVEAGTCWLPSSCPPHLKGLRPNGNPFWIEPKISRLDWSNGSTSILLIVSNMTPLVGLAESAKASRQRYQAVFNSAYDGILVEQNDIIVAANPAIARLFGYQPEELLNRPVAILFDAAEHAKVEANEPRAHFATNGLHESGRLLSMIFTATQITWGATPARLITIRNTSDTRKEEENLHTARDNGVDMIVCFDPNFRTTFANAAFARHHNVSRTEIIGRDVRELITREDRPTFQTNLTHLSPDHASVRTQTQGLLGEVMDWIDHAVFDEAGNPIEFQRIGRDISDLVSGLVTRS